MIHSFFIQHACHTVFFKKQKDGGLSLIFLFLFQQPQISFHRHRNPGDLQAVFFAYIPDVFHHILLCPTAAKADTVFFVYIDDPIISYPIPEAFFQNFSRHLIQLFSCGIWDSADTHTGIPCRKYQPYLLSFMTFLIIDQDVVPLFDQIAVPFHRNFSGLLKFRYLSAFSRSDQNT